MARPRFLALLAVMAACSAVAQSPILTPPAGPSPGTAMAFDVGSKQGDAFANLPAGTIQISNYGERPVFSPDGKKIAFIGKSYGDAFEYDIASGETRNLTNGFAHSGFIRVHYLPDGNYLLLGPVTNTGDRLAMRRQGISLWFMDRSGKRAPVALGMKLMEGIAVSRRTNLIAWSDAAGGGIGETAPDTRPDETTAVFTGRVEVDAKGAPRLVEVKEAFRRRNIDCYPEPQDFRDKDRELIHACYSIHYVFQPGLYHLNTGVWAARLDRPELIRYRGERPDEYAEPEGISPSERWTLVECGQTNRSGLDICRLTLEPDSNDYRKLTHVMDYGRWKASNPVVSPDGKWISFQSGKAFEEAGIGHGIYLMPLPAELR
ncbi:hypothetical protein PQ455_02570 [Sphingomonas naphthae]|uniref:Translocation protein TolB n=1 Tax=Sphingomonas naphthae TaxID=1813468 RepID=A0ABY7TMC0_9SPHN|nr:hypothetical protein [Sphingomonas naphthae]WCT74136.1 hypothetical protein PQ455_02570 [Sphingomonas naphthae]